ncbi:MAG: CotH kinase family protein [Chitinispirillaceae bacterium]|nr:CotH kinase family protein [Chitinispirillaceae bacterium]
MTSVVYAMTAGWLCFWGCAMEPPPPDLPSAGMNSIRIEVDWPAFASIVEDYNADVSIPCTASLFIGDERHRLGASLRIHGNTSRAYPKKSFRIKFRGQLLSSGALFEGCYPKPLSAQPYETLFLNANAIDGSCLRNALSFHLARRLDVPAPRTDFAELFINGLYYGLYGIIERVDELMVSRILGHSSYDQLKAETHNANLMPENHYYGRQESPEDFPGDSLVPPELGFQLQNGNVDALREVEYWIQSGTATLDSIERRLPESMLYGYFFCNLFINNTDGVDKNYYFINDNIHERLYFIPWDYDATFGRSWNGHPENPMGAEALASLNGLYRYLAYNTAWFDSLALRYAGRFRTVVSGPLLTGFIDDFEYRLADAAHRDMERWDARLSECFDEFGCFNWTVFAPNPQDRWRLAIEEIRTFIVKRTAAMDSELGYDQGRPTTARIESR